jgi:hypothetical protein
VREEEIDRVLGGEEDVLPSSGFHASVMEAVDREATTPPPIPFPWKRAWPAFVAAALTLAGSPFLLVQSGPLPVGAPWSVVAAVATAGSLFLSMRLSEKRY